MAFWWWYKQVQRLESPLYKLPVIFSKQRVLVVWREAAMTREWLDRLAGTIWVRAASLGREGCGQVEASSLLIKPLPLLLVKVDHFLQRLDFLGGQIGPFPPFNKKKDTKESQQIKEAHLNHLDHIIPKSFMRNLKASHKWAVDGAQIFKSGISARCELLVEPLGVRGVPDVIWWLISP